jgi:PDZ domain
MNRRGAIFWISVALLSFGGRARPVSRAQTASPTAQSSSCSARFALGGNAAEIPAEFVDDLIFVPALVNQSQPSLFALDTSAAVSAIDAGRAVELGLMSGSTANAEGIGLIRDPVLNLPGFGVPLASLVTATRKDFSAQVGRSYQGTLGNDVLRCAVVELDYARQTVRFYDPNAYHYSGSGKTLPLTFLDRRPAVQAKFVIPGRKAHEADFIVDTALDASIVISDRFAEANRVFSSRFKTIQAMYPQLDAGGTIALGRLKGFQLGSYVIELPVAVFSQTDSYTGTDPRIAGSIGGALLRRFNVILDFPHTQIILEPNSHFPEYNEEDMSGLAIVAKGGNLRTFEVVQVRPGTPAAEAGIQIGDAIGAVDGEAAADLTLASVRNLFRQIGHKYKILINRNGQTIEVSMQMRRLV